MKIYCFKYNGGYGGGCVIIAANSKEEAYGVLAIESEYLASELKISDCSEIKELYPGVDILKPKIIINSIYIE